MPSQNSAIDIITEKKNEKEINDKKKKEKNNGDTDEEIFSINFNSELRSNCKKDNFVNKENDDPYSMKNYYISHESNDKNNDNNSSKKNNNDNNNFDRNMNNENNVRSNNGTYSSNEQFKNYTARDLADSANNKLNVDPLTGTIISDHFTIIDIDDDNDDIHKNSSDNVIDNNNNNDNDNNNNNNDNNK